MIVVNPTPLRHIGFRHWIGDEEAGVVVARASFAIVEGERAVPLAEQPELATSDEFRSAPDASSLRRESELSPFKPRADVTFDAVARSPEAKALDSWPVRVEIVGRASHGLHVFGPREWEPARVAGVRKSWRLAPARPIRELPVTYEFAYGGTAHDEEGRTVAHAHNPVGRGYLTGALLARGEPRAAAQIGLVAEFIAADPAREMTVCGLGPLGKAWLPRRALAGTFDEAWKRERWPRMPADFSFEYWNGAPAALRLDPLLKGDERIRTMGLRHDPRAYEFQLPGLAPTCAIAFADGRISTPRALPLDTVHCELASEDPSQHRVTLVWRGLLREPNTIREARLGLTKL